MKTIPSFLGLACCLGVAAAQPYYITVRWVDSTGAVVRQETGQDRTPRKSPTWDAEAASSAQERILFLLNRKYGLADTSGRVVADPVYHNMFYDGGRFAVAITIKRGEENRFELQAGVLNTETGKEVAPLMYQNAKRFSEGLAAAQLGEKWGFMDTAARMAIPPLWDYVGSFQGGVARVISVPDSLLPKLHDAGNGDYIFVPTPGKCGYIDRRGNYVIPMDYSYIGYMSPSAPYAAFVKGEYVCDDDLGACENPYPGCKWGIMDIQGNIVVPDDYYDLIDHIYLRLNGSELVFVVAKQDDRGKLRYGLYSPENRALVLPVGSFDSWKGLKKRLKKEKRFLIPSR